MNHERMVIVSCVDDMLIRGPTDLVGEYVFIIPKYRMAAVGGYESIVIVLFRLQV